MIIPKQTKTKTKQANKQTNKQKTKTKQKSNIVWPKHKKESSTQLIYLTYSEHKIIPSINVFNDIRKINIGYPIKHVNLPLTGLTRMSYLTFTFNY